MLQAQQVSPQSVDHLRYWLEIAYFLSGVVLATFAGIALYQLKLAKDQLTLAKDSIFTAQENLKLAAQGLDTAKTDIKLRIKREAIVLAAQQCEKYADHILPRAKNSQEKLASL